MAESDIGVHGAAPGRTIPAVPLREGLPSTYRMRAEPHYVDQLSARSPTATIRLIEVGAIERGDGPVPAPAFVESVRHHGVLQPLLVTARGGRYQVIAGHKRLAAAVSAGLREVPCLLQRVDEEQAGVLAAATNVPSRDASARPDAAPPKGADPLSAVTDALSALSSAAHLLVDGSTGSPLARGVATDLVRAEAARALHLLLAARILDDRLPVMRSRAHLGQIAERAIRTAMPECRLRNVEVRLDMHALGDHVRGDETLLSHALAGLVLATAALGPAGHAITLSASPSRADGMVAVTVAQQAVSVPAGWLARAFDDGWPDGAGCSSQAAVLLRAARRVASLHGGRTHAAATGIGTELSIELPRGGPDR
jgi:hypothetical protein